MGSVFDTLQGALGWSVLSQQLGQSATQYRQGAASGTTVTVLNSNRVPRSDEQVGRDNVRTMQITVADSVPVSLRDLWDFGGERYTTRTYTPIPGQQIAVTIETKDRDRRNGVPGR